MKMLFLFLLFATCQKELPVETKFVTIGEPGHTPLKVAEGIISGSNTIEFGLVIDQHHNEMYFTRLDPSTGKMSIYVMMKHEAEKWTMPAIASFSGVYRDASPVFARNGKRIYFTSYRQSAKSRIWYCDRNSDDSWDTPVLLPMPDTIKSDIRNICFVNDTVVYFDMETGSNSNDIYRAVLDDDNDWISITHTGPEINSQGPDIEAAVHPDEEYMIFYSINRTGHIGPSNLGDLYISYKSGNNWTDPVNLGSPINSEMEENWPSVDFTNGILYFSSNRANPRNFPDIYMVKLDTYLRK
jgi:hypothetical protein